MKKIEELGISPAPWEVMDADSVCADVCSAEITEDVVSLVAESVELADARLIAAAPELYECLYEAVEFTCDNCNLKDGKGECTEGVCPWVKKWRAALAKAAGESEVAK